MSTAADGARPRLVITRRLPEPVEARARRDYDVRLNAEDVPFGPGDWATRTAGADAILCVASDRVDAAAVAAMPPSVRAIATFSVGYNHVDLEAAAARAIAVTNTPDVLTDATADVALLLLLGAARRAGEGEALMRARAWTGWAPTQMLGTHLGGRRLGILGLGRIGAAVARRAVAFGMEVHYLAARDKDVPGVPLVRHASEESFLPACQFLSLHVPLAPATRGWLNAARIARLPRGAIVVNTARGEVVDDAALVAALTSGHVAAAGLDVYAGEPNVHPAYAGLPNTFLLPHLGSATLETRCAMGFRALDNLDAIFAGRPPRDRVA